MLHIFILFFLLSVSLPQINCNNLLQSIQLPNNLTSNKLTSNKLTSNNSIILRSNNFQSFNYFVPTTFIIKKSARSYGGEEDECKADEIGASGLIGGILNGDSEAIAWGIKDLGVGLLSGAADVFWPGAGKFVETLGNTVGPRDPNELCLQQINQKLDKGFADLADAIKNSTDMILNAIKELAERIDDLEHELLLALTTERYKEIQNQIYYYQEDASKKLLNSNPKKINKIAFRNKCLGTPALPIETVIRDFSFQLRVSCDKNDCYTQKMYRKFSDPRIDHETRLMSKKQVMKIIFSDAVNLQHFALLCSLIQETEPEKQQNVFQDYNELINATIDYVEEVIMQDEIKKFNTEVDDFIKYLGDIFNDKHEELKSKPFWIEHAIDVIFKDVFKRYGVKFTVQGAVFKFCLWSACIFVERGAEYNLINCPKTSCRVLYNVNNMDIIIFSSMFVRKTEKMLSHHERELCEAGGFKRIIVGSEAPTKTMNASEYYNTFRQYYPYNKRNGGEYISNIVMLHSKNPNLRIFPVQDIFREKYVEHMNSGQDDSLYEFIETGSYPSYFKYYNYYINKEELVAEFMFT